MKDAILIENSFIRVNVSENNAPAASIEDLGTVLSNLAWFGYIPSSDLMSVLSALSSSELNLFWLHAKNVFANHFEEGMDAHNGVVYKNFPSEVINKSHAEYWIAQIFIYLGIPSGFFAEPVKEREVLNVDLNTLKVLKRAKESTLMDIFTSYHSRKVSLTPAQLETLPYLIKELALSHISVSDFDFKMNGVHGAIAAYKTNISVRAETATDILRIAIVLSGNKSNINQKITKFKFKRAERKFLLTMLCELFNYEEDIAARRETFKALFRALKPGDYAWAKSVSVIYDTLYQNKLRSFNGQVDLAKTQNNVFDLLKKRPGVFMRRFHEFYGVNKTEAVKNLVIILPQLTVFQLLKIKKYVENINNNDFIVAKAKSSWNHAKILDNTKVKFDSEHIKTIVNAINSVLKEKLELYLPEGVIAGQGLNDLKLPSNDQELSIGRGTVVELPEQIKVLRSATYWTDKNREHVGNFYFDNSWNLVHEEGIDKDLVVCWDHNDDNKSVGLFSGDPSIVNNENSVATQFIDINLDEAEKQGFKYALWNVLSFNDIKFNDAEKAFGCLQFLENPEKGSLFEPSKADINLSLKTNGTNKCLVLIDIKERKIIYLDMAFPKMSVQSAANNIKRIRDFIPALFEQLSLIPSIFDLVENAPKGTLPFVVSDKETAIKGKAYVFKQQNPENEVENLDLQTFLN